jgi:sulfite exporter TauE/SafE
MAIPWFELLTATLFASLLGSTHCVAMCGPFAIMMHGGNDHSGHWTYASTTRLAVYHLGRLSTYLTMSCIAIGAIGSANWLAPGQGLVQAFGMAVGLLLITMGIRRWFPNLGWATKGISLPHDGQWMRWWVQRLASFRRSFQSAPRLVQSYAWGVTSTLLPCGWLYLFVIASAAAPTAGEGLSMMIAFWIGTIPLLSLAGWGASWLGHRWQRMAQPLAGCMLIAFGTFTLLERATTLGDFVGFQQVPPNNLRSIDRAMERVRGAETVELPCCTSELPTSPQAYLRTTPGLPENGPAGNSSSP